MKVFNTWSCVVLALAAVQISSAQQQEAGRFAARDGYDQADFGTKVLTIKTRSASKSLRVSLSKVRVESRKTAAISLPKQGTVLLQHAAGTANVSVGGERFAPLEGEWMRLTLPAELRVGTEDDSVLMELIVVEEASSK